MFNTQETNELIPTIIQPRHTVMNCTSWKVFMSKRGALLRPCVRVLVIVAEAMRPRKSERKPSMRTVHTYPTWLNSRWNIMGYITPPRLVVSSQNKKAMGGGAPNPALANATPIAVPLRLTKCVDSAASEGKKLRALSDIKHAQRWEGLTLDRQTRQIRYPERA